MMSLYAAYQVFHVHESVESQVLACAYAVVARFWSTAVFRPVRVGADCFVSGEAMGVVNK